jgi:hypothetical protein
MTAIAGTPMTPSIDGQRSLPSTCCDPRRIVREDNGAPARWTITLNEYQRANLLWLLCDVAGYDRDRPAVHGLNTGDWLGELANALRINEHGAYEESAQPANAPVGESLLPFLSITTPSPQGKDP